MLLLLLIKPDRIEMFSVLYLMFIAQPVLISNCCLFAAQCCCLLVQVQSSKFHGLYGSVKHTTHLPQPVKQVVKGMREVRG